jgi:hypothetical protein
VAFAADPTGGLPSQNWEVYLELGGSNVREFGAGVAAGCNDSWWKVPLRYIDQKFS